MARVNQFKKDLMAEAIRRWYELLPEGQQEAKCRELGVSPRSIQYWKAGRRIPTKPAMLSRLYEITGNEVFQTKITGAVEIVQPSNAPSEKQTVVMTAGRLIEALLPLLEYVFSNACSTDDRRGLRSKTKSFARVGDLMNALSSDRSRKNFLAVIHREERKEEDENR